MKHSDKRNEVVKNFRFRFFHDKKKLPEWLAACENRLIKVANQIYERVRRPVCRFQLFPVAWLPRAQAKEGPDTETHQCLYD